MGLSLPHLIVLALVVLLLFGRGKISDLMGDFGKGIKSFKEGVADETTNHVVTPPPAQLTAQQPAANAPAQTFQQPPVQQPTLNGEPLPGQQGQR
jgi:sec-independent protein translocase protein TatA